MTTDLDTPLHNRGDESPVESGGGAPLLRAGPHRPPAGVLHLKQILEHSHQNIVPQVKSDS